MARKKAVKRENGRGTVEKGPGKLRPYKAKAPVGTKVDKNGKTKIWTGPTINKKTVYYRILIRRKKAEPIVEAK